MPDWSEHNMDKLFQEGAQRYDFTYKPEAWNAMESLLERDRRRRLMWWWLAGLTLALLLLSSVWLVIQKPNDGSVNTIQSFRIAIPDSITSTDTTAQADNKDWKVEHNPTNASEMRGPNAKSKAPSGKSRLHEEKVELINTRKENSLRLLPQTFTPDSAERNTEKRNTLPNVEAKTPPVQMIDTTTKAQDRPAIVISDIPTLTIKPDYRFSPAIPLSTPIVPESAVRRLPLMISVGGGAVWSSAGLDDYTRHSWRVGMEIEFQPWKRYSLSTGLFYTKLFYRAGEGDYQVSGDWLPEPEKLKSTDAICKVLEVPLLLHYYPKGYERPGFSYSAGLVSYIMAAEYYHYNYDPPDDELPPWWGTHYENYHWLGVGQLGMRYQQPLGNKTAVSVNPIIQIPLGGVGYGKVKLFNFGTDVRFHYRF